MSIKVMSSVWAHAAVRQGSLLVLLALADYANDNGICWPSIPHLMEKAHISRRHVQRILRELERKGLIAKERMAGRYEPNIYKVLCGRGDKMTPLNENQGRHLRHPGASFETLRGDAQTAQSVTEPSRKPPSGCVSTLERHEQQQREKTA